MSTSWVLRTNGNPLAATRRFLADLWQRAGLQGLIIPIYQSQGEGPVSPALIESPDGLLEADPFAPVVAQNSARLVLQVSKARPAGKYGAVLRSCEARALRKLSLDGLVNLDGWLIVGVDCLPSFPSRDLEWRTERAGSVHNLTREALRYARQGGIAPYRFRRGCQMCISPEPEEAQVFIFLYGLPVYEFILVKAGNEAISRQLQLEAYTKGRAAQALIATHDRALTTLKRRRMGVRQRAVRDIPKELPTDALSFLAWLQNCAPCQECLDACPIYASELQAILEGEAIMSESVRSWLASCLACGMCEEACPQGLPLTAIKSQIARQVTDWIL